MSDFRIAPGFEDVWRPVAGPRRTPQAVLAAGHTRDDARARLIRIVRRTPEVMVKVTGRTRDPSHLRAHLDYISRNGALEFEDQDGVRFAGRREVADLAEDWAAVSLQDPRRRANTPFSHSIVLSMPQGADPGAVQDAARAFAADRFGGRFDYVFVLHTDAAHPHVHLAVRSLGVGHARLNPKKADLETWRQVFAQALRDRDVEAEATPRRTRGVTRKAERSPVRKIRERHALGQGPAAKVFRAAVRDAARTALGPAPSPTVWELRLGARQRRVRGLYLAQARLLQASGDPADRRLGEEVAAFVRRMAPAETQRRQLIRVLRAAHVDGPALSTHRAVEPSGREHDR